MRYMNSGFMVPGNLWLSSVASCAQPNVVRALRSGAASYVSGCSALSLCTGGLSAFVDHNPVIFAMAKLCKPWSTHQQWYLSYVLKLDLRRVESKANMVAGCLSWSLAGAVHLGLDYAHVATDQVMDCGVWPPKFAKFLWHRLRNDVRTWADTCIVCQRSKMQRYIKAPLVQFGWVDLLPWVLLGLRTMLKEDF